MQQRASQSMPTEADRVNDRGNPYAAPDSPELVKEEPEPPASGGMVAAAYLSFLLIVPVATGIAGIVLVSACYVIGPIFDFGVRGLMSAAIAISCCIGVVSGAVAFHRIYVPRDNHRSGRL